MLNFEKKIAELQKEKTDAEKKRDEIITRFDDEIFKIKGKIKKLEEYRLEISHLTNQQIDTLTAANNLADKPAWQIQEDVSIAEPDAEVQKEDKEKIKL